MGELGLRDWVFARPSYPVIALLLASLGMIIALPLFLYGALTHYFLYRAGKKVSGRMKDPQFRSTFKFVTGVFLTPWYYLVLFIPVMIFTDPGWIKWVFLVSLIPAGIFAISYKTWFIKLRSLWRYQRMTRRKNEQLLHLKSLRKHILDRAEELVPA